MDNVTVGRVVFSSGAGRPERKDVTAQIDREKASHACECGKDRRIADLERDGAKLQGLNQRLAARVAELEAGKAPACECPTRKALEALIQRLEEADLPGYVYDEREAECVECGRKADTIRSIGHEDGCLMESVEASGAALSAPCPCEAEINRLRVKLFGTFNASRKVHGCSHSTACSIWGDDGQGGTVEGFTEPLPCNCGALENWEKNQKIETLNSMQAERDSLRARVETLPERFARAFYPRADHKYSGIDVYEWLKTECAALKEGK